MAGVADPAGTRDCDVAADREHEGEQQRLAAGPAMTEPALVGSPRRCQYPAAAARSAGCPATGPYELQAADSASAALSAGWTGSPASPNASGSTGWPLRSRAAMASLAASVADTGSAGCRRDICGRSHDGRGRVPRCHATAMVDWRAKPWSSVQAPAASRSRGCPGAESESARSFESTGVRRVCSA